MQTATMNNQHRSFLRHAAIMSGDKEAPVFNGPLPVIPFLHNFLPPFNNSTSIPYMSVPPPSLLFNNVEHCSLFNKKLPFSSDSGVLAGMTAPNTSNLNSNVALSKMSSNFFPPFPALPNSPFMNHIPSSAFSATGYKRFSPFDQCERFLSAALASRHSMSTIPKMIENFTKSTNDPFQKGRLIKMSDGEVKPVENLSLSDFEKSSESDGDLKLVPCDVCLIEVRHSENTARVQLNNLGKSFVIVIPVSKPFFTQASGWASVDPEACNNKHNLVASKLQLNDTCLCLIRKKKISVDKNRVASSSKRYSTEKSWHKTLRFQPYGGV